MALKKNSPLVYAVALCLFAGGVGFMVWSGIQSGKTYFLNVSEALGMPAEELRAARLFGTVGGERLSKADGSLGVSFVLQDAETPAKTLFVTYTGAVPDSFEPGAEVIVEGGMGASAFEATMLMTKCPSKYEKENRV